MDKREYMKQYRSRTEYQDQLKKYAKNNYRKRAKKYTHYRDWLITYITPTFIGTIVMTFKQFFDKPMENRDLYAVEFNKEIKKLVKDNPDFGNSCIAVANESQYEHSLDCQVIVKSITDCWDVSVANSILLIDRIIEKMGDISSYLPKISPLQGSEYCTNTD